jgi:hypothetical protein
MNPKRGQHLYATAFAIVGLLGLCAAALAVPVTKHNHHNAKELIGDKIKTDGRHEIDHKGKYHTSVDVKNGKIAAVHVRHETKGEIPVKKYKTHKKMAQVGGAHLMYASFLLAQNEDLGTEYIGYSYVDEYGNEEIYWVPYEMVLDGDTGAVEYIPES